MTDSITIELGSATLTEYAWVGSTSSTPLSLEHGIVVGPLLPSVIPEDEVFFWTEEWQAGEREADADIAAGRVLRFSSADDLIRDLYRARDDD